MNVMVNPSRKDGFHRAVRNAKGERSEILEFSVGEVVALTGKKLAAVQRDIDKGALVEVEPDERGKWRPTQAATEEDTVTIPKAEYESLLECAANAREMKDGAKAEGAREAIAAGSNGNGEHAQG